MENWLLLLHDKKLFSENMLTA